MAFYSSDIGLKSPSLYFKGENAPNFSIMNGILPITSFRFNHRQYYV
ncbi:hypothetical protein HMPREF9996_01353 [Aggregatibacter actinomycetemcomitans Y4]|nr:hypothetical protein CF65_01119 [Aggregatibacter actinomycetemcomitans HK1651]EKX96009.1 hypothetical protein HMPREF9996_01353 [Aggregatibacter actinomycetemcomitans Y4]